VTRRDPGSRPVARRFCVLALTASLTVVGGATLPAQADGGPVRPEVTDVAHRGASAYAPENTLAALETAAAQGASMVEIDVQRTADGELVLMHDTDLVRTTDAEQVFPGRDSYAVADFTLAEVDRLDAGSWFSGSFAGEPVPTLAETLDLVRDLDVGLLLEVKAPQLYPGIERQIVSELRRDPWWLRPARPGRAHRLVIQSFDRESMHRSHRLLPWIPHGLLGRVDEAEIARYARWADQINPSFTTVDADYVRAVHEAGMEVYVYTVNNAADMRAQIAKGVDGIITNYPDVLLDVIAEESRPHRAAA
jgi:glycerophosphoryl diester phosphodiesterase